MECDHKADHAAFFVTDHTESSITIKPATQSPSLIASITFLLPSQVQEKEERIMCLQEYFFHVQHQEARTYAPSSPC